MENEPGRQFSIGDVVFYRQYGSSKFYYKGEIAESSLSGGGKYKILVKTLLQKKSRQFSETCVLADASNIVHEEDFPAIEAGKTKVLVQRGSSTSSVKTEVLFFFFFNDELDLSEFFLLGDDFSYTGKNIGFFRTADREQQQGTPPPPPHSPTIYSLTHLLYFLSSLAHLLTYSLTHLLTYSTSSLVTIHSLTHLLAIFSFPTLTNSPPRRSSSG